MTSTQSTAALKEHGHEQDYVDALDTLREQYNALLKEWDAVAEDVFQASWRGGGGPQNGAEGEDNGGGEYVWTQTQSRTMQEADSGADNGQIPHPQDHTALANIVSSHPAVSLAVQKLSDLQFYCLPSDGKSSAHAILHDVIDRLSYILAEYCSLRADNYNDRSPNTRYRAGSWDFNSPANAKLRSIIHPVIERHIFWSLAPQLTDKYSRPQWQLDADEITQLVTSDVIPRDSEGSKDENDEQPLNEVDFSSLEQIVQKQATAEILLMLGSICPTDKLCAFQRSMKMLSRLVRLGWKVEDERLDKLFRESHSKSSVADNVDSYADLKESDNHSYQASHPKGKRSTKERKSRDRDDDGTSLPPTASQLERGDGAFSDNCGDDTNNFSQTSGGGGICSQIRRSSEGGSEEQQKTATETCKAWTFLLCNIVKVTNDENHNESTLESTLAKNYLVSQLLFLRTFGDWRDGETLYSDKQMDLTSAIETVVKPPDDIRYLLVSTTALIEYICQLLPDPDNTKQSQTDKEMTFGMTEEAVSNNASYHTSLTTLSLARAVIQGIRKATRYRFKRGLDPHDTANWLLQQMQLSYVTSSTLSISDVSDLVNHYVDLLAVSKYVCDSCSEVQALS